MAERYFAWRRTLRTGPLFALAFSEAALFLVAWAIGIAGILLVIAAPFAISPWFFALYFCLATACAAASNRKDNGHAD